MSRNLRVFGIVSLALATVIVLAGFAAAAYLTRYVSSIVVTTGTGTGTIADLTTVDGNVWNLTTAGSSFPTNQERRLNGDVAPVNGWGKSATCSQFYQCLTDTGGTDYNTTIVWNTANPVGIYFTHQGLTLSPTISFDSVNLFLVARKNTSDDPTLHMILYDTLTHAECTNVNPIMTGTGWDVYSTGLVTTCNGLPWTTDTFNRTQVNFTVDRSMTMTNVWIMAYYTIGFYQATAYLNGSFAATDLPYSVNWTCNRTLYADWTLSAERTTGWYVLSYDACDLGAQASYSAILPDPPGYFNIAGKFHLRLTSPIEVHNGSCDFDRLVVVANVTGGLGPPNVFDPSGIATLFIVLFFCGVAVIVALNLKRWREDL